MGGAVSQEFLLNCCSASQSEQRLPACFCVSLCKGLVLHYAACLNIEQPKPAHAAHFIKRNISECVEGFILTVLNILLYTVLMGNVNAVSLD